jgi:pyruvate dehydrogenase E2 component (dihydrolipoamide acetyltransferase)
MIVDFKLPNLGDNIHSADVIKVLVKEGEKLDVDQAVVEIETDKATVEVPSDISGTVKEVFVKAGGKADVGAPLFSVEVGSASNKSGEIKESSVEQKAGSELRQQKESGPVYTKPASHSGIYQFRIPVLGENITSAGITKILVKAGDSVAADQVVLEIETDKATIEVPTEVGGIIKEVKVREGDKAAVGEIAMLIETGKSAVSAEAPSQTKPISPAEEKPDTGNSSSPSLVDLTHHVPKVVTVPKDISKNIVPAAPSVRRFAREIGVDIHQVRGTNPAGRISFDDVKRYAKALNEKIQKGDFTTSGIGIAREPLPDFSKWGIVNRAPMSNIRRKTAEHLTYAWSTVPHVTQFDKADITELEKLRKRFGKKAEAAGGKLTVTSVLLKVLASAMKVFPQFNSSVDMEKSEVIYKKYYNIGVAVDTDRGLLVPVVRDVDKKNLVQLSVDLAEISKKARDKKLSPDEMQGGCFTISNLGGIGGTYFTPIINSPEVAILGISRSVQEPVYIDGKFEPRLIMPLSLSYDHRIIDGADAIRFLRWVIDALENPFLLCLEG